MIIDQDTLMSDEWTFMNEIIKEKCNCIHKQTCTEIVKLLNEHNIIWAREVLDHMKNGWLN